MKRVLEKSNVPRGEGYYFRSIKSNITYSVWHDTKTVTLASTAYTRHAESTVSRRVKDPATKTTTTKVFPAHLC